MQQTEKPLIAVDMDDVLFDFLGEFFLWHNEQFGTQFTPNDMIFSKLWEVWGGSKEEALERIKGFWQETDLLPIEPIAGAKQVLEQLKASYRLAVVSARFASTVAQSEAWLERYFPNIFEELELGISDPMSQERSRSKAEVCLEKGASMLIDDQLVHAIECSQAGIEVLLFGDQAHNRSEKLPEKVTRVVDWTAIGELLLK